MQNPLKAAAVAVISHIVPLALVYYFNGQEVFRETITSAQMKKAGVGVEPFLRRMREAGYEPAGSVQQTTGRDGIASITVPVTRDGQPGSFSVTVQARLSRL